MHSKSVFIVLLVFVNRIVFADNASIRISRQMTIETSVGTNVVLLQIEPHGPVPDSMAVVINPTNRMPFFQVDEMPGLQWVPFQSNVTVTLDAGRKNHTIMLGYKPLQAHWATWKQIGVTIANSKPRLVITSPAKPITKVGVLQIQGYAEFPIQSIAYRHNKPDGTSEPGEGFVTRQEIDPARPLVVSQSHFQCFDIELELGTNSFALMFTDNDGNTTSTNISVNLDPNSGTSTKISVLTPQPGGLVFQSGFTIFGMMDDPSATIEAKVSAEGQEVKLESGVGRKGEFHFSGITVNGATNQVTLVATDQAGNVTTTNFILLRSHVSVEVDKIPLEKLNAYVLTVTGKINVQDHALWVNGVRATVNPDGTWRAKRVPIEPGEGPFLTLKALPLSANTNAPGIQLAL